MPTLGRFSRALRARFWKPSVDEEVRSELDYHLEMLEAEYLARGMSRAAARAAARERFGDVARIGASCRDEGERRDREQARMLWLDELRQDLRQAVRQLRANPRFALVAVLTLALGLGASTTVFGIANAVLLRPLPFPEADRLVLALETTPAGAQWAVSESNFLDWRDRAGEFTALGAFAERTPALGGTGDPEQLRGAVATHDFFTVLGVPPVLGRAYTAAEDQRGGDWRVAVIGHSLWQRRFGGDPSVIGRTVELDGVRHRVVGVMPPGFDFPSEAEVWTPLVPVPEYPRGDKRLVGIGRLDPSSTRERAEAELAAIARQLSEAHPMDNGDWSAQARPFTEWYLTSPLRARVLVLLGAVGLLLALACVNVASLLLARAGAREREMAVRAALGAARGRIVRQLLTESMLLSLLGTVLGVALAAAAVPVVRHTGTAVVSRLGEMSLDWRVLGFAAAACLVTGLAFGLAPALRLAGGGRRRGARHVLLGGARVVDAGRLRSALVVGSVALASLLLVCGTLVGASFARLMRADLGFAAERVLTASVALPEERYEPADIAQFYSRLEARLRALPGVEAAGAVNIAPFSGGNTGMDWQLAATATRDADDYRNASWRAVTPGYFATLDIPLLRGRMFESGDRYPAPAVALINERLAQQVAPGGNAIGTRLLLGNDNELTVIGVVGDTRAVAMDTLPGPMMFFPIRQFAWPQMWLTVRTSGDPLAAAAAVRRAVAEIDPSVPLARVQPLTQLVRDVSAEPRLTTLVLGVFAVAALVLAAVGLYGVVSYGVVRQRREIGVRLALGAEPRRIVRTVVGQGARLALLGALLGSVAGYAAARPLQSILYETTPGEPLAYAAVALLLLLVVLMATAGPAARAARVDPASALRSE